MSPPSRNWKLPRICSCRSSLTRQRSSPTSRGCRYPNLPRHKTSWPGLTRPPLESAFNPKQSKIWGLSILSSSTLSHGLRMVIWINQEFSKSLIVSAPEIIAIQLTHVMSLLGTMCSVLLQLRQPLEQQLPPHKIRPLPLQREPQIPLSLPLERHVSVNAKRVTKNSTTNWLISRLTIVIMFWSIVSQACVSRKNK